MSNSLDITHIHRRPLQHIATERCDLQDKSDWLGVRLFQSLKPRTHNPRLSSGEGVLWKKLTGSRARF